MKASVFPISPGGRITAVIHLFIPKPIWYSVRAFAARMISFKPPASVGVKVVFSVPFSAVVSFWNWSSLDLGVA